MQLLGARVAVAVLPEHGLDRATRRKRDLARLSAALRAHDDLSRRIDLVLSIAGIGERTAVALLVGMPELGSLSREQAASLAGRVGNGRTDAACRLMFYLRLVRPRWQGGMG